MVKMRAIKKCRACKSAELQTVLSLGNLYLSDFQKALRKPPRHPLVLTLCKSCMLVQLKHTTPASRLYTQRYGYKSGINATVQRDLASVVRSALSYNKTKRTGLIALDIGANDGTLLGNYPKSVMTVGIEPISKFARECKKKAKVVINDYFKANALQRKLKDRKADIVTIISCFYDIDNPNKFLSDVKKILKPDGLIIIQQNYLPEMLRLNAFDNIVHEHLEYYSLLSLEKLLTKFDLEVFNVETSLINGGSFRTYIAPAGTRRVKKPVLDMRKSEIRLALHTLKPYREFAKRVLKNKKTLYSLVKKLARRSKRIYVYGASTRGNTLLQYYNLGNNFISKAVERNPEKWGKRIASLNIPIISEEQARAEMPDYMVVLPWFFKDEFLSREKAYLKKGGHFIFPLPKLEVL